MDCLAGLIWPVREDWAEEPVSGIDCPFSRLVS